MSEEYNKWYWKLYRWFRWEFKHLPRDISQGIKNLWKWFPIIWKDRDWDDHFIFEALKFKIKNTADYFVTNPRYVGVEEDVRDMRICVKLIERIQDDYYQSEYFNYLDDFNNKPIGDIKDYLAKYPNTIKLVKANPVYKNYRKTDRGLSLAVGIERHLKARKLLFKILERKIEHWWN